MTDTPPHFSLAMLTLPHEDPLEHAQLWSEWASGYPDCSPIERVYLEQAFTAMVEKRRIARTRATLRRQKVRTAVLLFDRAQQDYVAQCEDRFNDDPPSARVALLRSAAGCRFAIQYVEKLIKQLKDDGTWYGEYRHGAIQIQGKSARIDDLYFDEDAYTTWVDTLACQPNPKQADIDIILKRRNIPKGLQERDVVVWPRDVTAAKARLQKFVDSELERLKALEATLRVQYEEPARAEAEVMALASVTREEMQLLRAEQIHEQSYQRAVTALLKARKQTAASRTAAAEQRDEAPLVPTPNVARPRTFDSTPLRRDRTDVGTPPAPDVEGRSPDPAVVGEPEWRAPL